MNKEVFDKLICSYKFKEKEKIEHNKDLFKYYELKFDETDIRPDLTLYWYENEEFSLYKNEGFATIKLSSGRMNLYNIKLAIEDNIPNKILNEI